MINLGKLVSRQFQYIELELLQRAQLCKESGAKLKVTLEFPKLAQDLRVIGCKILKRAEVHYGRAATSAAVSDEDLQTLATRFGEVVRLDAGGNVTMLEEAKRLYRLGCARFTSRDPWLLLEAWKVELAEKAKASADLPRLSLSGGRDAHLVALRVGEDSEARSGHMLSRLNDCPAELLGFLQRRVDVVDGYEEQHLVLGTLARADRDVRATLDASIDERRDTDLSGFNAAPCISLIVAPIDCLCAES